jgi:protocatechuate 3,4-dioxygenase beta subunit
MRAWVPSVSLAALLLGCAMTSFGAESASVTGRVLDTNGNPVEHATVLVYEAYVKTGYSVYCPSCWPDCGKHAATDAAGNFTIGGLNPNLTFKLLVVKDGFSAAFTEKTDPAKGPAKAASMKPRTPIEDGSQLVLGRVIDRRGDPVKDAVVQQQGVLMANGGRRFGDLDWIDLMTVTNENGEFEMAYSKPAQGMIVSVTARGMAPKLFTEMTGKDRKTMAISEGATVRGRLVGPDGKPVSNAEIGLLTHSRWSGTTLPEVQIGTQEDGSFAITNVPAGRIWNLYPKMESLAARNLAGGSTAVETLDDGQVVNIGDIVVTPSYSLRGKVVLADGNPIPPNMHVSIGGDFGGDIQMAEIGPDGSFQFHGLARGVYDVSAGVRGYQMANNLPGEALVDRDGKTVTIRLEPAPRR